MPEPDRGNAPVSAPAVDLSKPESRTEPITFHTDSGVLAQIEELRAKKGLSRSDLCHRLIKAGLAAAVEADTER